MFEEYLSLFVKIMLYHWDQQIFAMLEPLDTKCILYTFNRRDMPKMKIMCRYFLDNEPFVDKFVYKDMLHLFCLSQRTYWTLNNFALKWKRKRMVSKVTDDLCMTKLSSFPLNTLITLYEQNSCYQFSLPDLNNIIIDAFTNCSHDYFLEIKPIKNPYTNLPFCNANLYNIYFAFKKSMFKVPLLLQGFLNCMIDPDIFLQNYEPMIRDYVIKVRVRNMRAPKMLKEVRKMLSDYDILPEYLIENINIHHQFPWESVVYQFRDFVRLYHLAKYSLNPYSKSIYKMQLIRHLCLFHTENPQYGRKFLNTTKKDQNKVESDIFVFGEKTHIMFNTTVKTHFKDMTKDQLTLNYASMRGRRLFSNSQSTTLEEE